MSRSETLGRVIYVGNVHNLGVLKVASEGAVFRGWGWLLFFFFYLYRFYIIWKWASVLPTTYVVN